MKIIVIGDIHMATGAASRIPGVREADLLVANGDLTNYGSTREVRRVLDDLLTLNPRLLAQFGNMDRPEVNDYLEALDLNLHGQARVVAGKVCIAGVGGSNPTPFGTPSEFSEQALQQLADSALNQALEFAELKKTLAQKRIPVILVSHCPPKDTAVDRIRNGRHVGSTAIRQAISRYQPDLVISGHIHEAKGVGEVGKVSVYNPGMLKEGGWITLQLHNSRVTATLS